MKKDFVYLCTGIIVGIYIGYQNEEELEHVYRQSKKAKRKMMKKMHIMSDDVCDYLDWK
ncbi:MAG: hypothetical protein RSC93_08265 [Erysipelotrichaceae bacterium]